MTKFFSGVILCLCGLPSLAQYHYLRLSRDYAQPQVAELYQPDTTYQRHTGIQPYRQDMLKSDSTKTGPWSESDNWWARKTFREHFVQIEKEDFALSIDPVMDLSVGSSLSGDGSYWRNTRGFLIDGRIGQKFSFRTYYLENQAKFPSYMREYIAYRNVVPGYGVVRPFNTGAYDFGLPGGEVSYIPNKYFAFTAGQGHNFFGEGYRSMLLSDNAFNYPFFRIHTKFWRIEYVNLWAQLYDIRPEASVSRGVYAKKFMSSHLLSINITKNWNLSLFESIVVGDTDQQRGLDASFLNPVIFYRPVEFAVGSSQGNALMGAMSSYTFSNKMQFYAQFLLDEFSIDAVLASEGSWLNKFSWQFGFKDYDFLGVKGLFTRIEGNFARPYTYSHKVPLTNYGHYNQSLAHPWGANFSELLAEVRYQRKRWMIDARLHYGTIGLDSNNSNWGTDIYRSYDGRERDLGNVIGQGIAANLFFAHARLAYQLNPKSGLLVELNYYYRNLSANLESNRPFSTGQDQWVSFGLRTALLNSYLDF